ncbi:helix-turn-helix transcriptional regulator [Marinobacter sp.]|uniref:helix-turn-helix domain-containing protein n=1 Tax=Marinobacter sp. TaxID=50741 RepID=UPI00261ACFFE|nr:helix-turn-helix transcriptional regulator [Marinobacter sp.]
MPRRLLRKARGVTLIELAKQTKSHEGNLSRIERDVANPSMELLYRLAEALDVSVTKLFQFSEGEHFGESQASLNANFSHLARSDQMLLVEFSNLLRKHAKVA